MLQNSTKGFLGAVQLGGLQIGATGQQLHTRRVGLCVQDWPQLPKGVQGTPLGDQQLSEPELLNDVCGSVGSTHGHTNGTR